MNASNGTNSTSVAGDLTALNEEQAKAMALNFVQALGNESMSDTDVFYAGLGAFFGTLGVAAYTPKQANLAFSRLQRIAPRK